MRFRALRGGWFAAGLWLAVFPATAATVLFVSAKSPAPPAAAWAWRAAEIHSETVRITDRAGGGLHGFWAAIPHGKIPALEGDSALETACRVGGADVVVALGWEATRTAAQECDRPLLAAQVSRQQWLSGALAPASAARTALYLEAEPRRQLPLVRAVLPQARRIGLLVPPDLPDWLPPLREAARDAGFELIEIPASSDQEAVRAVRVRLTDVDAVLLPPDTRLVNEWSLKPLLLMTVRQGVPVFGGLTERYVQAGVTAAVVADESGALDQVRPLLSPLARGTPPPPLYPTALRVAVNPTVARNLNIPDDAIERARALPLRP